MRYTTEYSTSTEGEHVRGKLPAALQAHLHIAQLFLDQGAQLALCPLDSGSQIFENLFEIFGRDLGQLFGRQKGNAAVQQTQCLSRFEI